MTLDSLLAPNGSAERYARQRALWLVGRTELTTSDADDFVQGALAAVAERWPTFNPRRASAATFVARIVNSHMASALRYRRQKRRDLRRSCSYTNHIEPAVEDSRLVSTDLRVDINQAVEQLAPELQLVCELLTHSSPTEVAHQLGLHRARVYEAIGKIRRRFESTGLQAYLPQEPDKSDADGVDR
jgi:RNA polymerase sigma factor (sigma-70 family)